MAKHRPNNPGKYNQGKYKVQNLSKYMGDPNEVWYRSGWEYKFFVYCDYTEDIIKWGAEPFKISYIDIKGKQRYYMPDVYLETISKQDPMQTNKFVVEIKPEKEIREPKMPKTVSSPKAMKKLEESWGVWLKNKHKWTFAVEWCKQRDMRFWLVTEKHLEELKMIQVPK